MRNGGSRLSRSGRRWRGRSGSWRGSAARSRPRARAPRPAGAATATPARRRGGSRAGRGDAGADACAPFGTTSLSHPTRTRAGRHEPGGSLPADLHVRRERTFWSADNGPTASSRTRFGAFPARLACRCAAGEARRGGADTPIVPGEIARWSRARRVRSFEPPQARISPRSRLTPRRPGRENRGWPNPTEVGDVLEPDGQRGREVLLRL